MGSYQIMVVCFYKYVKMRLFKEYKIIIVLLVLSIGNLELFAQPRQVINFTKDWFFVLDSTADYSDNSVDFSSWRKLNLPHDWSVEGSFNAENRSGTGGGYLPGGIGWYKKKFDLDYDIDQEVSISFDGIYERSEVWINGHFLGFRPNGFIGFTYDIGKFLHKDGKGNILTVKADNSKLPNTRFYTGSGIYRPVRVNKIGLVHIQNPFVFSNEVDLKRANVQVQLPIVNNSEQPQPVQVLTEVLDSKGGIVAKHLTAEEILVQAGETEVINTSVEVTNPALWSPEQPNLYRIRNTIVHQGKVLDKLETTTGLRYFKFDHKTGFWLNGVQMKIRGVCMHSDQGALGTAFNKQATLRQLKLLKEMGVNGIRTSHNPVSSDYLDLCDSLGFIVMNETFDVWKNKKNQYDYHQYWDDWFERDVADQIINDRNHPSVFMWCLGNEVQEQWHSATLGKSIPKRLAQIVDSLDGTRPTTIANNAISRDNPVLMSNDIDLIGYNYNENEWSQVPVVHPNKPFIATESVSALATRGQYDLVPHDSIRKWPVRWDIPFNGGNQDQSISAYDHVHAPWGSTHERSLYLSETLPWVSGMYIWTGFDYLGEPTPYTWPSRSSYFGIIDLAGFPKDVYYLYQSVWSDSTVLHLLPHWNWSAGDMVDVVAYYNHADEVELFLNGESVGVKSKVDSVLHVTWNVPFTPGELRAVSRKNGLTVKEAVVRTAGKPNLLRLSSEASCFNGKDDLIFIHAELCDHEGNLIPKAANLVTFKVEGDGELLVTDNGNPTDISDFSSPERNLLNGKALAVVRSNAVVGEIRLSAKSDGVPEAKMVIKIEQATKPLN